MTRISLLIFAVLWCSGLTVSLLEIEPSIIAKGTSKKIFILFVASIWLYVVAPLVSVLARDLYTLSMIPVFVLTYLPAILLSRSIAPRINTGFDLERKKSRIVERIGW